MNNAQKVRVGTSLIVAGICLFAIGIVFQIVMTLSGGSVMFLLTVVPFGLLLGAVGFCVRILAAVEGQRRPLHD
jgi:hypothetical protein